MPQSVEFGRTDFRHPAPWSRPSAALRWGAAVVLGCLVCLGLLVQTAGAATVSSEVSGYPVRLECGEGSVTFKLRSKPVVTYHGGHGVLPAGVREEYRRAGYLHPLVSPLGRVVTGDYPKNHLHHHGVWAPQQAGGFTLRPRGVHAMRYRILVADGTPDPKNIEQEWLEWSREP